MAAAATIKPLEAMPLFPACTYGEPYDVGNLLLYSLLESFSLCFINLDHFKVVCTYVATKSPQIVNLLFFEMFIH